MNRSWYFNEDGGASHSDARAEVRGPSGPGVPEEEGMEAVMRRLTKQIEESERRYSDALADLHQRLDQVTERTASTPTEGSAASEQLGRPHGEPQEAPKRGGKTEEDDKAHDPFELLEQHLTRIATDDDYRAASLPDPQETTHRFASLFESAERSAPPFVEDQAARAELDRRLAETAERLEAALNAYNPSEEIGALGGKIEDLSRRLDEALAKPETDALEAIETQLTELADALNAPDPHAARLDAVETRLGEVVVKLAEVPAQIEQTAVKAATDAAKLVAGARAAPDERMDAVNRNVTQLGEQARTIEAQLSSALGEMRQMLEQAIETRREASIVEPRHAGEKPEPAPFEAAWSPRTQTGSSPRDDAVPPAEAPSAAVLVPAPMPEPVPPQTLEAFAAPHSQPAPALWPEKIETPKTSDPARNRLGASIPDFIDQPFESVRGGSDADFIAAARRAARTAAAKAESGPKAAPDQRFNFDFRKIRLPAALLSNPRPLLIALAVALLATSAIILYSRLQSRSDSSGQPTTEQKAPGDSSLAPNSKVSVREPSTQTAQLLSPSGSEANQETAARGDDSAGEAVAPAERRYSGKLVTTVAKSDRPRTGFSGAKFTDQIRSESTEIASNDQAAEEDASAPRAGGPRGWTSSEPSDSRPWELSREDMTASIDKPDAEPSEPLTRIAPPAAPTAMAPIPVSVEASPVEALPVEALPVEASPVEASPVEASPVEPLPPEAARAQSARSEAASDHAAAPPPGIAQAESSSGPETTAPVAAHAEAEPASIVDSAPAWSLPATPAPRSDVRASEPEAPAETIPAIVVKAPAKPAIAAQEPVERPKAEASTGPDQPIDELNPNDSREMPPARIGPSSLRAAAANGDPNAAVEVGIRYAQGAGVTRDYGEAARWYSRAAAKGLAGAQYRLAVLYERGQGVSLDKERARVWYRRAAEQGNVKAMHNLAVMHTGQEGIPADYATAAKWFGEAAKRGLSDSQYNLGILFETGLGVKKSMGEAYKWFALAAMAGDGEALKRRDLVRQRLSPDMQREMDGAIRIWRAERPDSQANAIGPSYSGWNSAAAPSRGIISRVQGLLSDKGYAVGPTDGRMGDRTRQAIRSFERQSGMPETGDANEGLALQLESSGD